MIISKLDSNMYQDACQIQNMLSEHRDAGARTDPDSFYVKQAETYILSLVLAN
jgi:hypothetical protein